MDGRIRKGSTKITKPVISRNGSLQQLALSGKESSGSTIYTTFGRPTDEPYSKHASSKLQAFRYCEPPQPVTTPLPRARYTIDAVSSVPPTRACEPQRPGEYGIQVFASNSQELDSSYEYIRDDSHPLTACELSYERIQTNATNKSTARTSRQPSQDLPHVSQNGPSGGGSGDCNRDVGAVTQLVNHTEFEAKINNTTLMEIEEQSYTATPSETISSPLSQTGTGSPTGPYKKYHGQSLKPCITVTALQGNGMAYDDLGSFHGSKEPDNTTRGSCCSLTTWPPNGDDLHCSAHPSSSTLMGPESSSFPQKLAKRNDALLADKHVTHFDETCGASLTVANPLVQDVKCTALLEKAQGTVAFAENNVADKSLNVRRIPGKPITKEALTEAQGASMENPKRSGNLPQNGGPKPFLRPPFPSPVSNRSPVQGLTSTHTILRTCFRIGEALNASLSVHKAQQSAKHPAKPCHLQARETRLSSSATILIELYAFVEHSYRSNHIQFFRFADLFSPWRPPYLCGVWHKWNDNQAFDANGRAFLGEEGKEWKYNPNSAATNKRKRMSGSANAAWERSDHAMYRFDRRRKMCRVVGIIDRNTGYNGRSTFDEAGFVPCPGPCLVGVAIIIMGIWEADWSDIDYMKGIVEA